VLKYPLNRGKSHRYSESENIVFQDNSKNSVLKQILIGV